MHNRGHAVTKDANQIIQEASDKIRAYSEQVISEALRELAEAAFGGLKTQGSRRSSAKRKKAGRPRGPVPEETRAKLAENLKKAREAKRRKNEKSRQAAMESGKSKARSSKGAESATVNNKNSGSRGRNNKKSNQRIDA